MFIWWDFQEAIYYEILKLNENINLEHYQEQVLQLSDTIEKKCFLEIGMMKVILLHDNIYTRKIIVSQNLFLKTNILQNLFLQQQNIAITAYTLRKYNKVRTELAILNNSKIILT